MYRGRSLKALERQTEFNFTKCYYSNTLKAYCTQSGHCLIDVLPPYVASPKRPRTRRLQADLAHARQAPARDTHRFDVASTDDTLAAEQGGAGAPTGVLLSML